MRLTFTTETRALQDIDRALSPEAMNRRLAAFALEERDRAIGSGQASERYRRFVNGREGAQEAEVQFPGPVLYVFDYWAEIAEFALVFLRARSPVDSGDYRDAHVAMVNGQRVDPKAIPLGTSELVITNTVPYARKVHVGAMRMSVPPFIYEDARRAVAGRFGNAVSTSMEFLELPGGYVLKRGQGKRDRAAGGVVRYPSLVITAG